MTGVYRILLGTVMFGVILSGCNTIHGVGEDISAGGHAIQRAAS